jgi:hypothetical protein
MLCHKSKSFRATLQRTGCPVASALWRKIDRITTDDPVKVLLSWGPQERQASTEGERVGGAMIGVIVVRKPGGTRSL